MNVQETKGIDQEEMTTEATEATETDKTTDSSNDSDMIEISSKEYFYLRNEIIFLKGKYAALDEQLEKIFKERMVNQFNSQSHQQTSKPVVIKDTFDVSIDNNEEPMTIENLEAFLQNRIKVKEVEEGKYAILHTTHKVEDGKLYEIYLIANDGRLYLSDEGATIEELHKIFELGEPDVIKNLVAIIQRYGCKKIGKSITIDCTPEDIHIKISYLVQAISFMLNMKIFYV